MFQTTSLYTNLNLPLKPATQLCFIRWSHQKKVFFVDTAHLFILCQFLFTMQHFRLLSAFGHLSSLFGWCRFSKAFMQLDTFARRSLLSSSLFHISSPLSTHTHAHPPPIPPNFLLILLTNHSEAFFRVLFFHSTFLLCTFLDFDPVAKVNHIFSFHNSGRSFSNIHYIPLFDGAGRFPSPQRRASFFDQPFFVFLD